VIAAFTFNGRRTGAIGIFHVIDESFEGEGPDLPTCQEDARRKAYAAGWEHLSLFGYHVFPSSSTTTPDGWRVTVLDRPARAGEAGWWFDRVATVEQVLADVVKEREHDTGTPGGFGWPADAFLKPGQVEVRGDAQSRCLTVIAVRAGEVTP